MIPGIGQILRMNIVTSNDSEAQKTYKARLADVQNSFMVIEIPLEEHSGKAGLFMPNTELQIWHYGADSSKYSFLSKVIRRENSKIPVLLITIPSENEIKRTQRRNFLRVPANLEIAFYHQDRGQRFLCKTVDISGGGVAIIYKNEFNIREGDIFSCWMAIPFRKEMDHASFIGQAVRISPYEDGVHQLISVMFKEIKESERDKVIRYCFERQVDLHKKGVL